LRRRVRPREAVGSEEADIPDWTTVRTRYLNRGMAVETAPAVVFVAVNFIWDLMAATAAVIVATVLAVGYAYWRDRRVPALAVVTLILVLALGGVSLALQDEAFIKLKPTVGRCLFGVAVLAGLFFRPTFLERALGWTLSLRPRGWRVLALLWAGFAFLTAALNEVFRRTLTSDDWVLATAVTGPVSVLCYVLITRLAAPHFWVESGGDERR
jgi:intracellular septation protein